MNWKKITADLAARGVTQKTIADYCNCGQSTISDISRGEIGNPAYSIGKALIDLHEATCISDQVQNSRNLLPEKVAQKPKERAA